MTDMLWGRTHDCVRLKSPAADDELTKCTSKVTIMARAAAS